MVSAKSINRTARQRSVIVLTVCGALLAFALGGCKQSFAHESDPLLVEVLINQSRSVKLQVQLDLERHLALWESGSNSEHSTAVAARYERLQRLSPQAVSDRFQQAFQQGFSPIQLIGDSSQDVLLSPNSVYVDEPSHGQRKRNTTLSFVARLSGKDSGVRLRTGLDGVAMVVSYQGPEAEKYYVGARQYSAFFGLDGSVSKHDRSSFSSYLLGGFSHILPKGFDHVLFIAGLVLLAPGIRALALQVSLFTIAHSITLALGVLGLVNVPSALVEPLIAASIVYVCIDNLRATGDFRLRGFVIVLFGLLHGLGFASMLETTGLQPGALAEALLAFNLGIELAQLAVVAVLASLLALLQRYNPFQFIPLATCASVLTGIAGTLLLLERVVL